MVMHDAETDSRHLNLSTLEEFWAAGLAMEVPVSGSPQCRVRLDPKHSVISLVTPYRPPEPDVAKLKNIDFLVSVADGEDLAELTIDVDGPVHPAYALLATVADELQLRSASLSAAVASGVARYKGLTAARGGLTTEKEVGLYGELLLLEYLVSTLGPVAAVQAWVGPLTEEHDFVLDGLHLEVKTTASERRRHMIHGLNQLLPLHGVPLYLLSTQVTRSSGGLGRTLPRLVADVRTALGDHSSSVSAALDSSGWDDDEADLYTTVWTERATPRAYVISGDFPRLTEPLLEPVVPSFVRVSDVSYRVDVTELPFSALPSPLNGYVETPKETE